MKDMLLGLCLANGFRAIIYGVVALISFIASEDEYKEVYSYMLAFVVTFIVAVGAVKLQKVL